MKLNDIVYLKSSDEKLMITWLVGITETKDYPIDVNKALLMRPDYQIGDISIEYGKGNKATVPGICLIDSLSNRILVNNHIISVGNVVKHKLTDEEMTVIWVVGQKKAGTSPININEAYKMKGYQEGDIVCAYFDKKKYTTKICKLGQVEKIYE